jgi:hypothetical protein
MEWSRGRGGNPDFPNPSTSRLVRLFAGSSMTTTPSPGRTLIRTWYIEIYTVLAWLSWASGLCAFYATPMAKVTWVVLERGRREMEEGVTVTHKPLRYAALSGAAGTLESLPRNLRLTECCTGSTTLHSSFWMKATSNPIVTRKKVITKVSSANAFRYY